MANTTSSMIPGTTTNYLQPEYYDTTGAAVAGGVQDMLGSGGYLNNVMSNWYNTAPGQGALGQFAQYDPAKQQQFMNPYLEDAAQATMRLTNQNLNENVLPGVNSTFAGAGQFGSTRNADFTNRAIRDNQQALSGTLAAMYKGAQDTANQQYQSWNQMGANAAQQDYTNWLQQANYPLTSLGTLGQITSNIKPGSPAAITTEGSQATTLQQLLTALGALNTGAADGSLGGLTDYITSLFSNQSNTDTTEV